MEVFKQLLPLILMTTLLYFILVVPQRKKNKEFEKMLAGLQVNDEIITKGGIIGKIVNINDDTFIIQTGPDRVKIKIAKAGILDKVNENAAKEKIKEADSTEQ